LFATYGGLDFTEKLNFYAFALILLLRHQKYFLSLGIFFQTYKFLLTI